MNLGLMITLLKLFEESGLTAKKAPPDFKTDTKKVGDFCDSTFGLPPGTICVNNKIQPRLR